MSGAAHGLRGRDALGFALHAARAHRLRSFLTALGIAVGIAAVVLLTSIGEGLHRFVLAEFTQFGTNLIAVQPGRTQTLGISGATISNVRPLTLEDAAALARLDGVLGVVPVVQGNAAAQSGGRSRRTMVLGVGARMPEVFSMRVASGRFLPADDARAPRPYAVLGAKVRAELFGAGSALGQRIRVGTDRYRVIGVMESKGQFLGFDLDDAVYLPAAKVLELFNRESLMEIDVLYRADMSAASVKERIERLLEERHGYRDVTVITQQQMLDVLGSVLDVLTFAVGALGGISLLVGGVGILTIMTIAVRERTPEIGLLRALGAERRQVLRIFLLEAVLLSGVGALAGVAVASALLALVALLVPAAPVHPSPAYLGYALALALLIGLVAGVYPARRAAALAPLEALRAE